MSAVAYSTMEQSKLAPKQIFILSGQSNMSGRGGVNKQKLWDGIVPPACTADPSRIFRLNVDKQWEVAHEPLHSDIGTNRTCGVSPRMSFANAVKDRLPGSDSDHIGLVPCAVGGTPLKVWVRGSRVYEDMVERARAAAGMNSGGDGCGVGEIKALLWYQGDSDSNSVHDAESYESNMEKFVQTFRADLNLPSLPIIQVAIAGGGKYREIVREAQKRMKIANVKCVDAEGLKLEEDNQHLTTEAQVRLGQILAETYLQHFAPKSSS